MKLRFESSTELQTNTLRVIPNHTNLENRSISCAITIFNDVGVSDLVSLALCQSNYIHKSNILNRWIIILLRDTSTTQLNTAHWHLSHASEEMTHCQDLGFESWFKTLQHWWNTFVKTTKKLTSPFVSASFWHIILIFLLVFPSNFWCILGVSLSFPQTPRWASPTARCFTNSWDKAPWFRTIACRSWCNQDRWDHRSMEFPGSLNRW